METSLYECPVGPPRGCSRPKIRRLTLDVAPQVCGSMISEIALHDTRNRAFKVTSLVTCVTGTALLTPLRQCTHCYWCSTFVGLTGREQPDDLSDDLHHTLRRWTGADRGRVMVWLDQQPLSWVMLKSLRVDALSSRSPQRTIDLLPREKAIRQVPAPRPSTPPR